MVIDFSTMEEKRLHRFKGGEGVFIQKAYTDPLVKIMLDRLEPGSSIGMHTHETNSEMIYVVSGEAYFLYDDGSETVKAGQCHYCPKGHGHSMINRTDKDLVFFAVVPEQ